MAKKTLSPVDSYTGFVYLWHDRKKNKLYIGSHMGHVNDGYVAGTRWVKAAYKKRPSDFKRWILHWHLGCQDSLRAEEGRFLALIKTEQLGKKFYNFTLNPNGGNGGANKGRKASLEERQRRSIVSRKMWVKMKANGYTRGPMKEGHKESISRALKGRETSLEWRRNLSLAGKGRPSTRKGVPQTLDWIEKKAAKCRGQKPTKVVCEHCFLPSAPGMYKRWHGEACRNKTNG